ncbi:(2Fe-2S)-binding protein [Modestobacter versicolor]|uniref:(2Fe-2S)-binding protein n=1 Tax=Modestobacter versicolor TaxID=429133 RepID=UPI0034DFE880
MTSEDTFTFDGAPIAFRQGWSVGAALTAAGIRSWRTTRHEGRPRGLFCGIGVCFDCLVTVDGETSLRACLLPAAAGAAVTTQHGTGHDDRTC